MYPGGIGQESPAYMRLSDSLAASECSENCLSLATNLDTACGQPLQQRINSLDSVLSESHLSAQGIDNEYSSPGVVPPSSTPDLTHYASSCPTLDHNVDHPSVMIPFSQSLDHLSERADETCSPGLTANPPESLAEGADTTHFPASVAHNGERFPVYSFSSQKTVKNASVCDMAVSLDKLRPRPSSKDMDALPNPASLGRALKRRLQGSPPSASLAAPLCDLPGNSLPSRTASLASVMSGTGNDADISACESSVSESEFSHSQEPKHKRRRLGPIRMSGNSRYFAKEPATLRKARSLRTEASICPSEVGSKHGEAKENIPPPDAIEACPPYTQSRSPSPVETLTTPSSPVRKSTVHLPIIQVPVAELIPREPLCEEEAAERRVKMLLDRELQPDGSKPTGVNLVFISADAICPLSQDVGQDSATHSQSCEESEGESRSQSTEDGSASKAGTLIVSGDTHLDVDFRNDMRTKAIEWILTMVPPLDEDSAVLRKPRLFSRDLHDQFMNDPNTRFLAVYMFARCFSALMAAEDVHASDMSSSPEADAKSPALCQADLEEGQRRIVWDHAVASIALSTKMNRDTLPPLLPIYTRHYLVLAPHDMCYEDLELAQREILEVFQYKLGFGSPQAFLDEIYLAMPTLRLLVGYKEGWKIIENETWNCLFKAVRAPDMGRFPLSVLTATALKQSVIQSLVWRFETEMQKSCSLCVSRAQVENTPPPSALPLSARTKAYEVSRDVLTDLRELLKVSMRALEECTDWLIGICQ